MPRFYADATEATEADGEAREAGPRPSNSETRVRFWLPLLCITFFYYFCSCGIERIYQPMVILFLLLHITT
jgi:hypothetical protein